LVKLASDDFPVPFSQAVYKGSQLTMKGAEIGRGLAGA
jgi:hypothetical protein